MIGTPYPQTAVGVGELLILSTDKIGESRRR